MLDRLSLGPVFKYEWICATRRWQLYALRALFVGSFLIGLSIVWMSRRTQGPHVPLREMASFGGSLYFTIVSIQLLIVLFATPAVTAGSICLDKARGTLDHILTTDLSNSEIVLGKLAVRLIPTVTLVSCVLPVMVLMSLLGGIDPKSLVGSFIVTLGVATFASVLALAISVWGKKTHEVLLVTYLILLAWIMGPFFLMTIARSFASPAAAITVWEFLRITNPFYLVSAPYTQPGKIGYGTWSGFFATCSLFSLGLTILSTSKIRSVALKQAGRVDRGGKAMRPKAESPWTSWTSRIPRFSGPALDGNPVLWRE